MTRGNGLRTVVLATLGPVIESYGGPARVISQIDRGIRALGPRESRWAAEILARPATGREMDGDATRSRWRAAARRLPFQTQLKSGAWLVETLRMLQQFRRLAGRQRPLLRRSAIVHVHDPYALLALNALGGVRQPRILHLHNPGGVYRDHMALLYNGQSSAVGRLLKRLEEIALRSADAVVLPSESARALFQRDFGGVDLSDRRVIVVPSGIEFIGPGDRDALRIELALSADDRLLVSVGRLVRGKGTDILLRSLRTLADKGRNHLHLAVVGEGPELPSLRALAARLDVAPFVHWLGFRGDVVDVLAAADLFASPLRDYGGTLNLSTLEAMRAGLPIVATVAGGNEEAVDQGCAMLCDADNPDAFAAALASLLDDTPRAQALGAAARIRFDERFTMNRMLERCFDLYERLTAAGAPTR